MSEPAPEPAPGAGGPHHGFADGPASPSGRRKLQSLEVLRAVAALLVVLFHTQSIFGKRTGLHALAGIFANGNRGVDLFFVLSGFVITYVHQRDWDRPERLGRYLFNRAGRIYPSVWITTLLALGIYAIGFGGAEQAAKLQAWTVAASALLLPQQGDALVNVTWTLKYEVFFYLVFALLILDRRLGVLLGLWQAAILACFLAGITFEASWLRFYLSPLCLEFGIGMVCALLVARAAPVPGPVPAQMPPATPVPPAAPPRGRRDGMLALLWLGLLAGAVIFLGAALAEAYLPAPPAIPDFVLFGGSGGLVIVTLAFLERRAALPVGRGPVWRGLVYLGDASYSIYLVHFATINLVAALLQRLRFVPMTNIVFLTVGALGVGVGIVFYRFIDRPIQAALGRLKTRLFADPPIASQRIEPHGAVARSGLSAAGDAARHPRTISWSEVR